MICEGSCDTEDCSNATALISQQYIYISNFYSILLQINAGQTWNGSTCKKQKTVT